MAMAKGLGMAGAELIINGHSPEKMKDAIDPYTASGLRDHGYLFNVTNDRVVKEAINTIEKEVGPIDILINNAGIIKLNAFP